MLSLKIYLSRPEYILLRLLNSSDVYIEIHHEIFIFIFFIRSQLSVDPVKIDQKVTIAKGLNLRGQNFHFFIRGSKSQHWQT